MLSHAFCQPYILKGSSGYVHCVVDSESLLMTCENDDQMLSVADTATTPQPSEPAEMQILDEVTGSLCAVSSSSTSLQLPNPVDSLSLIHI